MWEIKKIISKGEYNYAVVKGHPNATKNDYVLHHRVVMENHLGRLLDKNEVVHHKDGNKKNNNIENLEVLDSREHVIHHQKTRGRMMVLLRCPICKKEFTLFKNQSFLNNKKSKYKCNCCSSKCRGKLYRYIQLHGLTHKVEDAISGNLLAEYRGYR